jgi:hypothetical protein
MGKKNKHTAEPSQEQQAGKSRASAFLGDRKLKGIILIVLGLGMLIFSGMVLWNRFTRPQPLAEILPEKSTIGFAEIDISPNSNQSKRFRELFQKYPAYDPLKFFHSFGLNLDYQKDLEPWLGRRVSLALLEDNSQQGQVNPLFFIETRDQEKALEFFKQKTSPGSGKYKNFDFYSSEDFDFFLLNKYMVVTGNSKTLEHFIDEYENGKKLQESEAYRKTANNLPKGGLVFAYMDMPNFYRALQNNARFKDQKGQIFSALQPFLKIFLSEGFTVFVGNNALNLQSFSFIDREHLDGAMYLTYNDKYQGKLLSLAAENPLILAGGHDLQKELGRLEELFRTGTKTSSAIFEGYLEDQKRKFLGKDLDLEEDLYPLLKGEYLVTIEKSLQEPQVSIFLQLQNKAEDRARVDKVVRAFAQMSGIFEPRIQELTLPDGTKSLEVVASPEEVIILDQSYKGVDITSLQLGNLKWGLYYTIVNDTLMLSTDAETLQNSIDRSLGRIQVNFKNNKKNEIKGNGDEVFFVRAQDMIDTLALGQNKVLKPYFEPFLNFYGVKNFFDDGISTLYTITLK